MDRYDAMYWVGAVVLVGGLILFLMPPTGHTKDDAKRSACLSNTKLLSRAALMYAEYDGSLPGRDNWMDAVLPYSGNDDYTTCPSAIPDNEKDRYPGPRSNYYGYAFNSVLDKAVVSKVKSPESTPMVYDSINLARNASDPFTSLPSPPRHKGEKNNVAYVDGHAKSVGPER